MRPKVALTDEQTLTTWVEFAVIPCCAKEPPCGYADGEATERFEGSEEEAKSFWVATELLQS